MNFSRIHQISFFSFISSSFPLQLDQGGIPAGYSLSLSHFPLVLFSWTQRMGGSPRQSCKDCTPSLSLSLQPPSTPNQHQATAQMNPRTPPASACSAPATLPLPRGPRSPRAHPCRPGCRGQASPCHCATGSPQPPSSMPNRLLPPMPSVGRPLAPALALSPASRERPERAPRSQPRKDENESFNARTCTAPYPL
jgi:hypothetical protein